MCIGGQQQDLRLATGHTIKHCSEYKYLGVKISKDRTIDEAIAERNVQARRAISMLNNTLWNKNIYTNNKKLIYNSIVKSIKTYSSEIWPLK